MGGLLNMIGKRSGKLLVVAEGGRSAAGQAKWVCKCDCGGTSEVKGQHLRNGNTRSCGCEKYSGFIPYNTSRHGHSPSSGHSKTYASWAAARNRCTNPNDQFWHCYGGRGIFMCKLWLEDFAVFLSDMGERPSGTTLDRRDPNKGYEPDNCRWATPLEQGRTRRNTKISLEMLREIFRAYDEGVLYAKLAEKFGVSKTAIRYYILRREVYAPLLEELK